MKASRFVDEVTIHALAGDGGNGCVGFRREKFVPMGGPDGGDGGNGGSVILQADRNTDSLEHLFFAPHQRAEHGGHGLGKKLHGKTGKDTITCVPCGTEAREQESREFLGELVEHGSRLLVAKGGRGGLGNCHWQTPWHQAPREHTDGEAGEQKVLRLEMKLVADAGLVGYPNAGKSSLLAALSRAHPKIAAYPFTTLHPVLGTVTFEKDLSRFKIADIPGLIGGAHNGTGLGHCFLRHVERSACLLFVLDMSGIEGRSPADDYFSLLKELDLYKEGISTRPSLLIANKMDIPDSAKNLKKFAKLVRKKPIPVSALTGEGIEALKKALLRLRNAAARASRKPHRPANFSPDIEVARGE